MKLKIGQTKVVAALYMQSFPTPSPTVVGFSHTKKFWANIFVAMSGDLATADNLDYYKINATKIAAWDLATRRKKYYDVGGIDDPDNQRLAIYDRIAVLRADSSDALQKALHDPILKQFITYHRITRTQAIKIVTTDLKVPLSSAEKKFGTMPTQLTETEIKIGNSQLYFPEGARESNVKTLTNLVTNVYNDLKSHGLEKLFTHPIRFVKNLGNTLGYYAQLDKDIKIAYTASNDDRTVFTILHEYGHKYYYEFFNQQPAVKNKWRDLRQTGTSYKDSDVSKTNDEQAKKLLAHLKVGDVLISKGRKYKGEWIVTQISGTKIALKQESFDKDHTKLSVRNISGPATYFMTGDDWTSKNPDVATIMKYSPAVVQKHAIESTDAWFPTPYSETKPEEWFAELFAMHIAGKLKGEVESYMKELVK
jgi:hypothetical protein